METGRHPPLNFVIVGGGPTGVELAGAISDIARLYMTQDFRHIDPTTAKVLILEGSPQSSRAIRRICSRRRVEQLAKLGVKVRTGCARHRRPAGLCDGRRGTYRQRVHAMGRGRAGFAAGQDARASACLLPGSPWLRAGRRASESSEASGNLRLRRSGARRGERPAGSRRRPAGHADGQLRGGTDRAACNEPAGAAKQKPFRYFDKGDMATIGRKAAVARIVWPFHAHWSGFIAWVMWLWCTSSFSSAFATGWRSSASGPIPTSACRMACALLSAHRSCRAGTR